MLATFSAQLRQSHDRWLLLWPGAGATPIDALAPTVQREADRESTARDTAQPALRTTLVVLDGTWQQAKQIHALNKAALDALCIQVSFAGSDRESAEGVEGDTHVSSSGWIRLQPRDHFLSTLESVGLALQTLEGQRGPSIRAALLRVFDRMNERQRVFYTAEKAHAPAQKQQKKAINAMEATLVEPPTRSAGGKPKYFVLCREERTAEDRRVMRQVGKAVLCTFDGTFDGPIRLPPSCRSLCSVFCSMCIVRSFSYGFRRSAAPVHTHQSRARAISWQPLLRSHPLARAGARSRTEAEQRQNRGRGTEPRY